MYTELNQKTPYYLYDLDLLNQTLSSAKESADKYGYNIHYAIKANNNPVITEIISSYGMGSDCVSGNEILESIHRGFPANKIVFAGVGKADDEIEQALISNIFCLNCESIEELEVIEQIAGRMNKKANIALRVNPDIDALTHKRISTGQEENKFGINLSFLQKALDICKESEWLNFKGLHFHIGSQITIMEPFINLAKKVNIIWKEFNIADYGGKVLNLGGGLGVDYLNPQENNVPDFEEFFKVISSNIDVPSPVSIHFELGRSLVAQCGKLITKVLYTKIGINKSFVIIDAGMTELMRPALYNAIHKIENLSSNKASETYDVVGPVCESTDIFAKNYQLPKTSRGDLIALHTCGAYGESMMLNFNMRPKPESFYILDSKISSASSLEKNSSVIN